MIIIHNCLLQNAHSITSSASAGGHCAAEKRDELASFQLQDIKLTRISQEVTATRARPRQGRSGADQIFSAASLLADQQEKHSSNYRQRNQNTDNERDNRMSTGLEPLRPSAFLRRSEAEPEWKIAHRPIPRYSHSGFGLHRRQGRYPSSADILRSSEARLRPRHQFISAVQTSAEECPGQQSLQLPTARMEAPPSPELPPKPVPATAAIAGPAP
jgi:hypothetical protein